jgi:hypothetical protein
MAAAPSRQRVRRATIAVAAAAAALAAVVAPSTPASSETAIAPGRATAYAQAIKFNPRAASLSLGITVGLSLADYANKVSRAETRGIDLGIIGALLAAEGCDGGDPTLPAERQPQALRVDSREPGAAEGRHEVEYAGFDKTVRASDKPESFAETVVAPIVVPGLFAVRGTRSLASTMLTEQGLREARALTEVGELVIGEAVRLTGLRWEAVHHTGSEKSLAGKFTIAAATIGGAEVPVESAASVVDAVNKVLLPVGVQLVLPVVREGAGTLFVEPLQLAIVPARQRDNLLAPVINDVLQPARQPIVEALRAISCKTNDLITVGDVAIGSISGAGRFTLELGGVSAVTSDIDFSNALGGAGTRLPAIPAPVHISTAPALRPLAPVPVPVPPRPAVPVQEEAVQPAPPIFTQPVAATSNERGGLLAVIAAVGLALLAALAELDRRRIRRAVLAPEEG